MIQTLNLRIPNTLGVKEFELEFNNLTYDIYYETFNKDLHISFLECIKTGGGITRAFAHRLVYAMAKTKNDKIISFRDFLNGLDDHIGDYTSGIGWGTKFSEFVMNSPFGADTLNIVPKQESKVAVKKDELPKN